MGTKGQSTSPNVPSYLKKPAKMIAGEAQRLYEDPRYAVRPGFDPATERALMMREARASAGNPMGSAAADEITKTLNGWYLSPDSNPWIREIANRAAGDAAGAAASRFSAGGRAGSGAYGAAIADAEMGTRASIYGANYDAERGRMQNAVQLAPSAYAMNFADLAMLEDVGRSRETEADKQFFYPQERLNQYANTIYGNPSFSTPGTTAKQPFNWQTLVSGMMSPQMPGMGGGGGGGGGLMSEIFG